MFSPLNYHKNNKLITKATVKHVLTSMHKESIIRMVLEMYDARKEAKEYLDYYANPTETVS